jgi:hypothetical protein
LFCPSFVFGVGSRLFGFVTNFYNVSRHVLGDVYADVPHARMESYLDSELYAGNMEQSGRGLCDFDLEYCHSYAPACHYSTPNRMRAITSIVRRRLPHKFRDERRDHSPVGWTTMEASSLVPPPLEKPITNIPLLVIDIVSVGSQTNSEGEYFQAQEETFGSHKSVRNFFKITNDDPICDSTNETLATESLCSQRHSILGLYKALLQYNEKRQALPDYMILMKDDTFYNLEVFQEILSRDYANASLPWAIAGCRRDFFHFPFAAPVSDLGFILTRGSLQRLIRPIHCPPDKDQQHIHREQPDHDRWVNETETNRCRAVQASRIREGPMFQEGMTVADLMYAYVTHHPPLELKYCTRNTFCDHSDW